MTAVLTVNVGSGTVKFARFDWDEATPDGDLRARWRARLVIHDRPARLEIDGDDVGDVDVGDDVVGAGLDAVWSHAPESTRDDVEVVAHRIVHGGELRATTLLDEAAVRAIRRAEPLAPLHVPAALAGIDAARDALPRARHVGVFDTAFHATLPAAAKAVPGPRRWFDDGLVRFGFHGISHAAVADAVAARLERDDLRIVSCHLGGGCSVTAIDAGRSVDTTMGVTPLDGLMMAERSGAVDPGLLLHLLRERGLTVDELDDTLHHRSGLLGMSGVSGDASEVRAAAERSDAGARLAIDVYDRRIRAAVASMAAAMEGLDVVAFTGGADSPALRTSVCRPLRFLGVELDDQRNRAAGDDLSIVSTAASDVAVVALATDEERRMAREALRVAEDQSSR